MTIPTIPDNTNKIIIAIGVAIILYAFYDYEAGNKKYLEQQAQIDSTENQLLDKSSRVDYNLKKIKEKADIIAKRNNQVNPITDKDSLILFNRIVEGNKNQQNINDSIWNLYDRFSDERFELDQLAKKVKTNRELNKYYLEIHKLEGEIKDYQIYIGSIIIVLGLINLARQQSLADKLLKLEIKAKSTYDNCQSCGLKFNSLVSKGTMADGGLNPGFCSQCFKDGDFTDKDLTSEKVTFTILKEIKKSNRITRWLISNRVNNLERWNKNKYL